MSNIEVVAIWKLATPPRRSAAARAAAAGAECGPDATGLQRLALIACRRGELGRRKPSESTGADAAESRDAKHAGMMQRCLPAP